MPICLKSVIINIIKKIHFKKVDRCRISLSVGRQLPKLNRRVRLPYPAVVDRKCNYISTSLFCLIIRLVAIDDRISIKEEHESKQTNQSRGFGNL